MSLTRFSISAALLAASISIANAQSTVIELTRDQVESEVASGNSYPLRRLVRIAQRRTGGDLLNIRAYKSDVVFYEFLFKEDDGSLQTIYLIGANGKTASTVNKDIREIAEIVNDSSAHDQALGNSNASSTALDNAANENGNGNGNSGNSGNGNSGNGNGNSGNSKGNGKNN